MLKLLKNIKTKEGENGTDSPEIEVVMSKSNVMWLTSCEIVGKQDFGPLQEWSLTCQTTNFQYGDETTTQKSSWTLSTLWLKNATLWASMVLKDDLDFCLHHVVAYSNHVVAVVSSEKYFFCLIMNLVRKVIPRWYAPLIMMQNHVCQLIWLLKHIFFSKYLFKSEISPHTYSFSHVLRNF